MVSATVDKDPASYGSTGSSTCDLYDPLYEWPENRHDEGMYLNLSFHKGGTAKITVEAGGVKKIFYVIVDDEV